MGVFYYDSSTDGCGFHVDTTIQWARKTTSCGTIQNGIRFDSQNVFYESHDPTCSSCRFGPTRSPALNIEGGLTMKCTLSSQNKCSKYGEDSWDLSAALAI
jgi:hypothetical protein